LQEPETDSPSDDHERQRHTTNDDGEQVNDSPWSLSAEAAIEGPVGEEKSESTNTSDHARDNRRLNPRPVLVAQRILPPAPTRQFVHDLVH